MKIDKNIIKKAQAGDVKAFGEIFQRLNKPIYNFLMYHSSNRELAEDLTQETFIRAFKSMKSLKSHKAFVSWLHQVALNLYRDEMKKKRLYTESIDRNPSMDDDDDGRMEIEDWTKDPDRVTADKELQNTVREAIRSLPEIHRTVVVMHHLEGMDVKNIAKTLEVKKGTVMSRLARAREALKEKLAFYVGDKL